MTANPVPREPSEVVHESLALHVSMAACGEGTTEKSAAVAREGFKALAALAVQATETETLRAALRDVLNEFNEQDITRSLRRSEWVGKERIVVWAALTDHGTSPSQDAQEPT